MFFFFGSSDFQPTQLEGNTLWLDASDTSTITDSSGSVSAWADKSGNGNNATQGTGSAQPTTGLNTANGKNAIFFDGNDTLEVGSGVYSIPSDESTLFIVSRATDTTAQRRLFVMTNGGTARYKMAYETKAGAASDTEVVFQVDSNLDPLGAQASGASADYQVLTGSFNGTDTTTIAINDGTEVSDTNGVAFTATNCFIGSQTGSAVFLIGDIGEIIVYNRLLSTAEQNLVKSYLTNKWLGFKTPTDIAGLQAWYDTTDDSYLTLDGTAITQMLDRSGNGNDTGVQGTASARPTRTDNQINGLQAAVFDDSDYLDLPSALYTLPEGDSTIFTVVNRAVDGVVDRIISFGVSGSTRLTLGYASTEEALFVNNTSFTEVRADADTGVDNIITGFRSGTTQSISVNGGAATTDSNAVNGTGVNQGRIGVNPAADSNFLNGIFAELLIFNRALTSTEIDNINTYLSNKYNIGLA